MHILPEAQVVIFPVEEQEPTRQGGERPYPIYSFLHAVPFRGAGETIEGAGGESGFQTRRAVVEANQPVGVHKLGCPAAQGVHPNGGVLPDIGMVQNQFPAHQGNVVGGGQVSRRR